MSVRKRKQKTKTHVDLKKKEKKKEEEKSRRLNTVLRVKYTRLQAWLSKTNLHTGVTIFCCLMLLLLLMFSSFLSVGGGWDGG